MYNWGVVLPFPSSSAGTRRKKLTWQTVDVAAWAVCNSLGAALRSVSLIPSQRMRALSPHTDAITQVSRFFVVVVQPVRRAAARRAP
jgi:hypothetical protein